MLYCIIRTTRSWQPTTYSPWSLRPGQNSTRSNHASISHLPLGAGMIPHGVIPAPNLSAAKRSATSPPCTSQSVPSLHNVGRARDWAKSNKPSGPHGEANKDSRPPPKNTSTPKSNSLPRTSTRSSFTDLHNNHTVIFRSRMQKDGPLIGDGQPQNL